jgi:hypothetical protein
MLWGAQAGGPPSPRSMLVGCDKDIDSLKTTQLLKAVSAARARSFIVVKKLLL